MSDCLREWMVRNGAELKNCIVAKEMPEMGGGMGLCSSKDLQPGSRLASVPLNLMFTTRKARAHKVFGLLYTEKELCPLQILPLFLAYESRDKDSFWYPWVSRLPRQYDTLVECPETLLHNLEFCKRRHQKVVHEQAVLRGLYEEAIRVISSKELPSSLKPADLQRVREVQNLDYEEFAAFYCSVMSRGFYYDIDASRHDVWTMIPWLDYFNYTDSTGHSAGFNSKHQRFEVIVHSPISAGDQVLLHYGTYSNFELLMWYGFVLHSNRNLEYRLSPMADANGVVPHDDTQWATEILASLSTAFSTIPWASQGLVDLWCAAVPKMKERGLLGRWTIAPCRGSHKGVEMAVETPPRLSQDLRDAVAFLLLVAQGEGVKFTSDVPAAELIRAIAQAELSTQWKEPVETHEPSYTARSIFFMLHEEYTLLQKLSSLPLDVWQAALSNPGQ
eukprot:TRINITY_DN116_c0_g2_i1.p2 TRINITY_DN116_c0_g2~~TRINITY_DN116_c0_g2_i1.p2  ORF type:complete len:446 (+),score=179.12 TRINITY_DN116_c0_g2_i1:77-1414(+)